MAKSIVGLDIAGTSVRAVEVSDATKARPTIVRFAELPLPEGAVSRGEVIEQNTVAGALKKLWSLGRFRSKDVVLGMGNQRVLSRDLTVPKQPLAQIRESLPFQVQDMLPVPVVDAILDFYPTSEGASEAGSVVNGLLIAAVKDAVLANVQAVQLAGLNPAGVDLIPFALNRVLVGRQNLRGTVTMIEIGAQTTSVVVTTDGIPKFVRLIPTGGEDVTKTLSARLEIPFEHAETVKRHLGIAGSPQTVDDSRAIAVTRETVNELLASLRNTINYFTSTHPSEQVSGIVLSGGGAHLPGFAAALAEYARLPVMIGNAFENVAVARSISQQDVAQRGGSIAVAYGLAVGSKAA
ncbi:type IV pilus assembly protein PilM [Curtobacterium sp. MCBD17_019]|uniref:type IV pilus assembly protein PilM n=1 Tax=Curtobacterium sp. MCBD17_019 TaxID=2175669 RepID=UPI000DA80DE3|nr:type IV pilus assembly protein PilM [Curtobacterium sp. MCBD17_019]PZE74092.1 pilus assembly protein PilM [Curtobacterium sp. MCBD17_019]